MYRLVWICNHLHTLNIQFCPRPILTQSPFSNLMCWKSMEGKLDRWLQSLTDEYLAWQQDLPGRRRNPRWPRCVPYGTSGLYCLAHRLIMSWGYFNSQNEHVILRCNNLPQPSPPIRIFSYTWIDNRILFLKEKKSWRDLTIL